jgi:hypothetical protein
MIGSSSHAMSMSIAHINQDPQQELLASSIPPALPSTPPPPSFSQEPTNELPLFPPIAMLPQAYTSCIASPSTLSHAGFSTVPNDDNGSTGPHKLGPVQCLVVEDRFETPTAQLRPRRLSIARKSERSLSFCPT